jgi:hypothetical protein
VTTPTEYFLGSSSAELDRLRLQAKIYEKHTRWLLDRIPIQPGWRALDVACGPVGIVPLLAERVGPTGEVISLDSDERMVENARAVVVDQGLTALWRDRILEKGLFSPSQLSELVDALRGHLEQPRALLFLLICSSRHGADVRWPQDRGWLEHDEVLALLGRLAETGGAQGRLGAMRFATHPLRLRHPTEIGRRVRTAAISGTADPMQNGAIFDRDMTKHRA